MGADKAGDQSATGSPARQATLRLSPLAPARKTRSSAGTRVPRSGPPAQFGLLTLLGQSDPALERLFLPHTCHSL
jgi:hypothetical protein